MIVVLFSYTMREGPPVGEEEATDDRMWKIVSTMPGFISNKGYTAEDGERVAVVRFESIEALDGWKAEPRHRRAQERAREAFYERYWVQACETVRSYRFTRSRGYEPIPLEVFQAGARNPLP
jgi:heme-degrading monooxygenase HmoA